MKLKKYRLDFDPAWKYAFNNLENTNRLSIELLNLLNFKNGSFFTLLPENFNFERLYDFKTGLILPQMPKEEEVIDGQKIIFSQIPNIEDALIESLLMEIKLDTRFSYVIDKVTGTAGKNYYIYYNDCHPLFHNDEVYFLLFNENISRSTIKKCLTASLSFWHSLCILTKADFRNVGENLTLEKIKEICILIELLIIGAYDGEGYIFWEKNSNKNRFFSQIEGNDLK